jgi:hypothetical protein
LKELKKVELWKREKLDLKCLEIAEPEESEAHEKPNILST